jgi:hypothetical protein
MNVQRDLFREPLDVLLARDFGNRDRLDYLRGWRKRAQGKGDQALAKRIAFAMLEVQRELGMDWPRGCTSEL